MGLQRAFGSCGFFWIGWRSIPRAVRQSKGKPAGWRPGAGAGREGSPCCEEGGSRVKVNVWGINYHPEQVGIAVYNTELCQFLAGQGHEVTMVTSFPYYPDWRKRPPDRGCLFRSERVEQVEVRRCWHYVPAEPTAIKRMLCELTFVITSTVTQLLLPRADVYVVVSPPLLLGLAAWGVTSIKRSPFIFHVQDLQPDAAAGLGMLKHKMLVGMLYGLESLAYDKASVVSGISPEMCRAFHRKGVPDSKIFLLPNWVDCRTLARPPARGSWRRRHGIAPDMPIVSYAGNIGVKQGLDTVLEAARLLAARSPAIFVIAGEGACKRDLLALAERHKLGNLMFFGVLSPEEHTELLADSDVCLITQKRGSGAAFLPSKLLKTLAVGRPVVSNAAPDSALYEAVAAGGFGLNVAPEDAGELAEAISLLLSDPGRRAAMGAAGRQYVLQFDKQEVLPRFAADLQDLVRGQWPG